MEYYGEIILPENRRVLTQGDKKLKQFIMLLVLSCLFTGCVENSAVIKKENEKDNENNNVSVKPINEDFSYLDELPDKQLNDYKLFANDKDTSHLLDFSPEQIVLIYFHSVVIADVEAIYALSLGDGSRHEFDEFKTEYYTYLHHHDSENALMYRDYNSIVILEDTKSEDEVAVVIEVSICTYSSSVVTGLKKDNNVWKMDISQLIEHFKKVKN